MSIEQYLIEVHKNIKNPNVLDIGANVGNFSIFCKQIWPESKILMIEGNPNCKPYLEKTTIPFFITLLSDSEKEVDFFIDPNNNTATGASYYKEVTTIYKNAQSNKSVTKTLDSIISEKFDLIKIDTQGSELDIIRGGKNIISNACAVILELPIKQYNFGSPLLSEIVIEMDSLGFPYMRIIDRHRWPNNDGLFQYGEVFQIDAVFTK